MSRSVQAKIDLLNIPLDTLLHEAFLRTTPQGVELLKKQQFYKAFKKRCQTVAWSKQQLFSHTTISDLLDNDEFRQWLKSDTPASKHVTTFFVAHNISVT